MVWLLCHKMYLYQSYMVGVEEDGLLAADLQLLESRPTPPTVLDNNINNAANNDDDDDDGMLYTH